MAVKISKNGWIGGGVAGVAVLAVGVGWALAGPGDGADASPAVRVTVTAESTDVAAESTDVAPVVATVGAEAAVDPIEVVVDPDGIADDEYPEAAPARPTMSDNEFDMPVEYPDALVMEDWVWERVGKGWSVTTVGLPDAKYPANDYEIPPAVLYLVSPENVYFEVAELPEELWDGVRVVSWNEDDDSVRLSYGGLGDQGARFEMRTGEWEEIVFAAYGATASANEFVAADAEGNELWMARSESGIKYYRWDAASHAWSASVLVEEARGFNAFQGGIAVSWYSVAPDGGTIVLDRWSDEDPAEADLVIYDLESDEIVSTFDSVTDSDVIDPFYAGFSWYDDNTILMMQIGDVLRSLDVTTGAVTTADGWDRWSGVGDLSTTWSVGYGRATVPDVTVRDCGC